MNTKPNYVLQGYSLEGNRYSGGQDIFCLVWKTKLIAVFTKSPLTTCFLPGQGEFSVHLKTYFLKIHYIGASPLALQFLLSQ